MYCNKIILSLPVPHQGRLVPREWTQTNPLKSIFWYCRPIHDKNNITLSSLLDFYDHLEGLKLVKLERSSFDSPVVGPPTCPARYSFSKEHADIIWWGFLASSLCKSLFWRDVPSLVSAQSSASLVILPTMLIWGIRFTFWLSVCSIDPVLPLTFVCDSSRSASFLSRQQRLTVSLLCAGTRLCALTVRIKFRVLCRWPYVEINNDWGAPI